MKAGQLVGDDDVIAIDDPANAYVSRAALKLKGKMHDDQTKTLMTVSGDYNLAKSSGKGAYCAWFSGVREVGAIHTWYQPYRASRCFRFARREYRLNPATRQVRIKS